MRSGQEIDCENPSDCEGAADEGYWGDKFISSNKGHKTNSVYIANATEYGLFIYESYEIHTVQIIFDWETLVSNLSVGLVLSRWVLALVSLHLGAFCGKSLWFSGGIGCVSGAGSFKYLPLASLPRLKITLAAFWTVGCRFEGQQAGLAESWFAVYPAIVNFVLIYYSLLNFLGKILRRRVSDVLFTPTIVTLCVMHYFRLELAASGWLKGIDGRIPTVVFSDEVKKMQLADYITTDLAWRMSGRVALLFHVKLAILAVNLIPLLVARSFPVGQRCSDLGLHGVEKAFALHARYVGGLGRSLTYMVAVVDRNERRLSSSSFTAKVVSTVSDDGGADSKTTTTITPLTPILDQCSDSQSVNPKANNNAPQSLTTHKIVLVNSYEIIRLGYLVYGDKYLITFDDWDLLSSMAPFRSFCHFWNHRVLAWRLRPVATDGDAETAGGRALQTTEPADVASRRSSIATSSLVASVSL
ncbi:unnamed protein product [Phytophthora lilii]|uniref:Unnamed protein product n=1 Tax=Phytophthora lilii TaxID=2077276 RepID=A0A9W7D937_9STRA|nr:unnamed protein product [Phytophthora lilii]